MTQCDVERCISLHLAERTCRTCSPIFAPIRPLVCIGVLLDVAASLQSTGACCYLLRTQCLGRVVGAAGVLHKQSPGIRDSRLVRLKPSPQRPLLSITKQLSLLVGEWLRMIWSYKTHRLANSLLQICLQQKLSEVTMYRNPASPEWEMQKRENLDPVGVGIWNVASRRAPDG